MVTSDVAEFDSLCKKLLFDFEHVEEWSQIFMQLDDVYIDDLLPTEIENPYIVEARRDYRARLADTLSAAALRLMEVGEFQASLCFARAALLRDTTREDSYTTLMKSQIALGQRAAALETYFKCRYCLVEELGIDPSEKTTLLYNSIIAEEPGFKTYELPLALAQQGA
jgi:DNA-binding SARP family transcriptional activator